MAIHGSCFFDYANRLISDQSCTEVVARNVVSLAYYSVYHAALDLADNVRDIPLSSMGGGGVHKALSDFFLNSKGLSAHSSSILNEDLRREFRLAGGKLLRLHGQRVIADYKIEIDFNLSSAKDVIRLCGSVHEFIHKINKLIKA